MPKQSIATIHHVLDDLSEDIKELKVIAKQTNGRISNLELWRARLAGGITVIILLMVPIVIQFISKIALAYFQ